MVFMLVFNVLLVFFRRGGFEGKLPNTFHRFKVIGCGRDLLVGRLLGCLLWLGCWVALK